MKSIRSKKTARKYIAVLVAAACGGIPQAVCLAEISFGVGTEVEYTTNSTRVPTNELSDTIVSGFAGVVHHDRTADTETRLRAVGEVRYYLEDTYGERSSADVDAFGQWTISPQRFLWVLEDRYRQVVVNPLLADTPTNRENANTASTGPDFIFRFSPAQEFNLGLRYGRVHVSNLNLDSDRQALAARWRYETSSTTTSSLNYEYTNVEYDDSTANVDFAKHNYFLRVVMRPSRSVFTLDLGMTTIDREGLPKLDGSLAHLRWDRHISSDTRFGLAISSEYSDVGAELASPGGQTSDLIFSGGDAVISNDVFYSKKIDLQYVRMGTVGWSIASFAREIDYEVSPDDRKEFDVRLDVTITPSSVHDWGLFAGRLQTEFTNFYREDVDGTFGARYNRNLGRGLTLTLQAQRLRTNSTDPTREFTDDRALLSLSYRTSALFSR